MKGRRSMGDTLKSTSKCSGMSRWISRSPQTRKWWIPGRPKGHTWGRPGRMGSSSTLDWVGRCSMKSWTSRQLKQVVSTRTGEVSQEKLEAVLEQAEQAGEAYRTKLEVVLEWMSWRECPGLDWLLRWSRPAWVGGDAGLGQAKQEEGGRLGWSVHKRLGARKWRGAINSRNATHIC